MRLLSNTPSKLAEQDFFGHRDKAEALKSFFRTYVDEITKNKMYALYGEWGSGKTSVMDYLNDELKKEYYHTVFFEAWKHEGDDNLTSSLLEAIMDSFDNNITTEEKLQTIFSGIKAIGKGISVDLGFMSVDFEKIISSGEDEVNKMWNEISFHNRIKLFQEKFISLERNVLTKSGKKKIMIFIDDLDRCEPNNVIELLSAIKLFFTLGKNTVFFFGIDKNAVQKAVYLKYGDVIKSEEYLEKIIDVSFAMPKSYFTMRLLEHYFNNRSESDLLKIHSLFTNLHFVTPRHLKKVLNKYEVLKHYKMDNELATKFKLMIPDIYDDYGKGNLLETILTLYIIVLYEFYPDKFIELENYHQKVSTYTDAIYNGMRSRSNFASTYSGAVGVVRNYLMPSQLSINLSQLVKNGTIRFGAPTQPTYRIYKLLTLFLPNDISTIDELPNTDREFIEMFMKRKYEIETGFCSYLTSIQGEIIGSSSSYVFSNFFTMVKTLL